MKFNKELQTNENLLKRYVQRMDLKYKEEEYYSFHLGPDARLIAQAAKNYRIESTY